MKRGRTNKTKKNNPNRTKKDNAINKKNLNEIKIYGVHARQALTGAGPKMEVLYTLPRGFIAPDRVITTLCFVDVSHGSLNSAGNKVASYRYRPTNAFDVDPTLGGTTIAGFNEWASFYNYYRVLGYTMEVKIANADSFGLTVYSIPLNTDPGAAPSLATVESYQMNPFIKTKYISAKGGLDEAQFYHKVDCRSMVGSNTQRYDDSYSALVSTGPVNNIYHQIGILSISNNLVNGVYYYIRIGIEIEFFDRAILSA